MQAWAALEVFAIDGGRDLDFLSRVFDKLLVNFTWWVNLEDADGSNLFEGGFLGLDNIGPIDRSHLPVGGILEQSDATGWMAFYALAMAAIAVVLNRSGQRPGIDLVLKFLEHFAAIRDAIDSQGLWDDAGRVVLRPAGHPGRDRGAGQGPVHGRHHPDAGRGRDRRADARTAPDGGQAVRRLLGPAGPAGPARSCRETGLMRGRARAASGCCSSVVGIDRLERLFTKLFDEAEFLSPYGLRACPPTTATIPTSWTSRAFSATIDYEPAESTTAMFGGNSNWRGPLWFPLNYLVLDALERYDRFFGDEFKVEYPTGSGQQADARPRSPTTCAAG